MTSLDIRKYLTSDFSTEEKQSYINYINGNNRDSLWIEKGLAKREPLLVKQLICKKEEDGIICNKWINIYENGNCLCSGGHDCCSIVLDSIK